jgi:hypothetical protein
MTIWGETVTVIFTLPLTLSLSTETRESAISALTLMSYLVGITGAVIVVIVVTVAHTRERESERA